MLKISFFGASVTQQKDGFARVFSDQHPEYVCSIFGYGARHLKDAGICLLDLVIAEPADFAVIDWFSTGFVRLENIERIKIFVNTQVHKFASAGIRPIYLFLPQTDDVKPTYSLIQAYLHQLNIPYIDIAGGVADPSTCLRDSVHTSPAGAHYYAKLISDYFFTHWNSYPSPIGVPPANKYCDIKSLEINLQIPHYIEFDGDCEVIGIAQLVGLYSGYVTIGNTISLNWDRWCHYEREMINFSFNVAGVTMVSVLDHEFDRSACGEFVDWPAKKQLKLFRAYYIGATLRIVDLA